MTEREAVDRRWRLAVIMAAISSGFSTLVILAGSGRIGRDVGLSFMEVGMVLLRDAAITARPEAPGIAAGLVVHIGADVAWAILFWGVLGGWTQRQPPWVVFALAPVWAVATSATEYFVILPWLQPWLIMQTPYWIALLVHLASAATYPVFYLVRAFVAGRSTPYERVGRLTAAAMAAVAAVLGLAAALGESGNEVAWPRSGQEEAFDDDFLARMTEHHDVGVVMAGLAGDRASRPELRDLGRLMVAEQTAESAYMAQWWKSWHGTTVPDVPHDHVPGMPTDAELERLRSLAGAAFDEAFVPLMIVHHQGGIAMADAAFASSVDPRVRLLADQIRHAQEGQIAMMQGRSPVRPSSAVPRSATAP